MSLPPGPTAPRPLTVGRFMLSRRAFWTPARAAAATTSRCGPPRDRRSCSRSDPEAVKQVFTGDPELLHAGEGNVVLAPLLGPRSVLLLDGAEHLRHRRLLLPPFHGERMRAYGEMMAEVAERQWRWPRGRRSRSCRACRRSRSR